MGVSSALKNQSRRDLSMTIYRHQGKWRYDFWKKGIRHRQAGYLTKEKARIAEAEARKKVKKTNTDFISWCESRLDDLNERRSHKYAKENGWLIKKLILKWGSLKEITRQNIEDFLKGKSPYVANKELRMIKALFNHAVERELAGYNPAQKVKYFSVKREKKYIPPKVDVDKVLTILNPEQRDYILTIINTMARVSEVNQLKWEDVREDYLILRTRKSRNSDLTERAIPLNQTLKQIFKHRKEGYVFINKGEPYGYRSKFLTNACRKAGVKRFTFHSLRHYGASMLANAGVPLPVIQELLGHSQITTTDIYLQSIRGSLKDAVKKLEV